MKLIQGDSLEELKKLDDDSIDSIVTDPPYGLSFMGKKWDYDVPKVEIWVECMRVLKPGGFLLSFAGTRTQHRMAVNIEDAGFEIRDMIAWVYGSGFPKSHNIGKAVDKLEGNEREYLGFDKSKLRNPGNYTGGKYSEMRESDYNTKATITKGNSPYEGWGTALKPSLEPITVARKPFKGTVASNVLKYGCGGINIDACRVGSERRIFESGGIKSGANNFVGNKEHITSGIRDVQGRFPANFIHDGSEEVVGLFPETKTGAVKNKVDNGANQPINLGGGLTKERPADSGSASRFFYCAKASKADRNEGLEDFEEKTMYENGKRKGMNNSETYYDPRTDKTYKTPKAITKNNHPTVKPTALMQYLVRLVTPPNGTCLDPFMGSGSTGKACKLEGFDFIGIDLDPEYVKIAKARIEAVPKTLF